MDRVLILDFGSQVTQLIARRIRKEKIYCEIHPYNISKEKIIMLSKPRRSAMQEINSSSMSDIAFLLLVFEVL